jgi:pimeloyl-ACP methyl ester carboxylesterase
MASESTATIAVDGGRIGYRRVGSGRPLVVLNGLAATGADWDPAFIDRLASANELVLLDNRGIEALPRTTESHSISHDLPMTPRE